VTSCLGKRIVFADKGLGKSWCIFFPDLYLPSFITFPPIPQPRSKAQRPTQSRPHPSAQFDRDPANSPSNPGSASTRREPRSLNLGTLSTIHGSRPVDHAPRCLDLGPRTVVHGCYPYCYPK